MMITFIRTAVLYAVVIVALRLMGKRQIGELQPGELVITILISECAAAPLQDLNRPVVNGIIAIFTLVILEILLSCLTLKLPALRRAVDGRPLPVIQNGRLQQSALRRLRISVEELTEALRQQGFFSLEEVACCLVETNGQISVLPKAENKPATAGMVGAAVRPAALPCLVIDDGRLQPRGLRLCGQSRAAVNAILQKEGITMGDVFCMTLDETGRYRLWKREANA